MLQLLAEKSVATCIDLMETQQLLTEVRKHLNPIQHSKLNTLIKEYETNKSESPAIDLEGSKSENKIVLTRDHVRQQEPLTKYQAMTISKIIAETKILFAKYKAESQARVDTLKALFEAVKFRPASKLATARLPHGEPIVSGIMTIVVIV